MSEMSEIINRCQFKNLISYIISGKADYEPENETEQNIIEKSFDVLFDYLEEMFPNANRENEKLYNAVKEFSSTHKKTYLEMGILIGFQLHKTVSTTLETFPRVENVTDDTEILENFVEARIKNGLDDIVNKNSEYIETLEQQLKSSNRINKMGLTERQLLAVDNLEAAVIANGAAYGKIAYKLGFCDGLKLTFEIR